MSDNKGGSGGCALFILIWGTIIACAVFDRIAGKEIVIGAKRDEINPFANHRYTVLDTKNSWVLIQDETGKRWAWAKTELYWHTAPVK